MIWDRGEFMCFTLIFYTAPLNSKWFMTGFFLFKFGWVNGAMKNLKVCSGI